MDRILLLFHRHHYPIFNFVKGFKCWPRLHNIAFQLAKLIVQLVLSFNCIFHLRLEVDLGCRYVVYFANNFIDLLFLHPKPSIFERWSSRLLVSYKSYFWWWSVGRWVFIRRNLLYVPILEYCDFKFQTVDCWWHLFKLSIQLEETFLLVELFYLDESVWNQLHSIFVTLYLILQRFISSLAFIQNIFSKLSQYLLQYVRHWLLLTKTLNHLGYQFCALLIGINFLKLHLNLCSQLFWNCDSPLVWV